MRYLVTGAPVSIGSNTVGELVRRGHSVVVLDDLSSGRKTTSPKSATKLLSSRQHYRHRGCAKAMHEAEYVLLSPLALQCRAPSKTHRDQQDQHRWHAKRFGRCKRIEGQARGLCRLFVGLRRDPGTAEDRDDAAQPISPYGVTKYSVNSTGKHLAAAMASKMSPSATSIFLGRVRIPARLIPVCSPSSARRPGRYATACFW